MRRVLFATSRDHPELTADDRLAVAALDGLGIEVAPVVWADTPPEMLNGGDAVVIRSCWDYHVYPEEFERWVTACEQSGAAVINAPALLRWNLHKRYLRELEAQGVEIVPTVWVEGGDARPLGEVLRGAGWSEAVVKPAVSLSAYETWRTSPGAAAAHQARFEALRRRGDVLVQRFAPEIATRGEWSLVFFGGVYSHAVRKLPKPGDFRVQMDHGGTARREVPPAVLVQAAERVLEVLPEPPVYARVDGIAVGERLVLMELECIDPVLYFGMEPLAAERFARRVVERAGSGFNHPLCPSR